MSLRRSVRRWGIPGSAALVGLLAVGWVVFAVSTSDTSAPSPLEQSPTTPRAADALAPGDTYVTVEKVYARHGRSTRIDLTGPETQIVTTRVDLGQDGCPDEVSSESAATTGEVLQTNATKRGQEGPLAELLTRTCIDAIQSRRQDRLDEIAKADGAEIVSETSSEIVAQVPAPYREGLYENSVPYGGDLDIVSAEYSFTIARDTMEIVRSEYRVRTADGSTVVLVRRELVDAFVVQSKVD